MSGTVTVETTVLAVTVVTEPALSITVAPQTVATVEVDIGGTGPQGPSGPAGPAGAPGPAGATHEHTQGAASAVWTVNHNLGFRPAVSAINAGSETVEGRVLHVSTNQLTITFNTAISGIARCN